MGDYMGGEVVSYNKKGTSCLLPVTTAALGALATITFTKIYDLFIQSKSKAHIISVPYEVEKIIYIDKPYNVSIPYEIEKPVYIDKIINVPMPYEVEKTTYIDKFIEVPVEVEKIVYVDRVLIQPHDANDFNSPCF